MLHVVIFSTNKKWNFPFCLPNNCNAIWYRNLLLDVCSTHLFVCQLQASWIISCLCRWCLRCNLQFAALDSYASDLCSRYTCKSTQWNEKSSAHSKLNIASRLNAFRWRRQSVCSHVNHIENERFPNSLFVLLTKDLNWKERTSNS